MRDAGALSSTDSSNLLLTAENSDERCSKSGQQKSRPEDLLFLCYLRVLRGKSTYDASDTTIQLRYSILPAIQSTAEWLTLQEDGCSPCCLIVPD